MYAYINSVFISIGLLKILWMGQLSAILNNLALCVSSRFPISSNFGEMVVLFSLSSRSNSISSFTSCSSQPFLSAYILTVALVQAAKADANNSLGEKPKSFPPIAIGSSAITILPVGDLISTLQSSFLMPADTFAINIIFLLV